MEHKDKVEAAKRLIADKTIMALLTEYLLQPDEELTPDLIASLDNARLGEMVRADVLAGVKVKERFGRIKNLSLQGTGGKNNKVKE